jgi:hypothetical protein
MSTGEESDIYLGFDPGGDRGFGAAVLRGVEVKVTTVSTVGEAIRWACANCGRNCPKAAGIDTLLHWCGGPGGWRAADKELRAAYSEARSSVLSPNGLYGSMVVGGMALALRLRQRWPEIALNETHPKLLGYALRRVRRTDGDPKAAICWLAQHACLDLAAIVMGHELPSSRRGQPVRVCRRGGMISCETTQARSFRSEK